MIRYTTPVVELIVEETDLTPYEIYVTFKQNGKILTFTDENGIEVLFDGTDTIVTVPFSQTESAMFRASKMAEVQINWTYEGMRNATEIANIDISRNLLEEVIDDA